MPEFELNEIRKIDGEFVKVDKISISEIRRRKEECLGIVAGIQLKLDDLEYKKKIQEEEIALIDDLLKRKDDYGRKNV